MTTDAKPNMSPDMVCAFALHRGRYCKRPAGHEATDGPVPRHDSSGRTATPAAQLSPGEGPHERGAE